MESVVRRFFTPPSFYDEDEARIARMLIVTIFIILLIAAIRTIYTVFSGSNALNTVIVVNTVLLITFTGAYGLMRRGYLQSASIVLTASQWLLIAGGVWSLGGISVNGYSIFVFVIFVAGLLLGGRWAIGYALLSILYGSLMLYLENQGFLVPAQEDGTLGYLTSTPSFITTAVLVYLYDRGIVNALHRARSNEQEMIQHAAELERANAQLAREMDKRKRLEAQLLQSQKLEAIGRLSGGIAHDLNNLLVPILGYVELSLLRTAADQKLHQHLMQVKKGAEKAANLTKQILAFGRKQVLEIAPFDPNEAVQSFEKMIRRLIDENIEMQIQLIRSDTLVLADKTQFEQVLMNLVINARDAMPDGGRLNITLEDAYVDASYPEVQEQELTAGHYVMLAVSDTGHGMDAATRRQIFDPFFTTKAESKGTGLGLSTVFGIVKQHKGHIWVYSEKGHGTTFKTYWPRAGEAAVARPKAAAEPETFEGQETILVVEDNEMIRHFIYEALETHGYQVLSAESAQEAVQLAAEGTRDIDLVLTDVVMPSLNGRQVHQRIAAYRPAIKVLYMSGYTDDIIAHHGLLEKEINFLPKPFSITDLTKKIRQVLE